MATRKVCVASSAGKAIKIDNFAGVTWADLKPSVNNVLVGDYEAVLRPGNLTLRDDSVLPDDDFKVIIIPAKNKAGMTGEEVVSIVAAVLNSAELATEEEEQELKSSLIELVNDRYGVDLEECAECDEAIAEARKYAGV